MVYEITPTYEIIPVSGSNYDMFDCGSVIKLNLRSDAFGDSIFEISDDDSDSFMKVYSLWVEVNALYRVIESIEDVYGNNDLMVLSSIDDEKLYCDEMYDYLAGVFGDTVLTSRKNTNGRYDTLSFEEKLGELRGTTVNKKDMLKEKIFDSYNFGDLLKETVHKLMNLCDGGENNKIRWYIDICFNRIDHAKKFQEIIYPKLQKQNCDTYVFSSN